MTNRPSPIQNIVFDLDVTLIDSSADIIDCLKKAYQEAGFDMKDKIPKNVIGPPLSEIIKTLTPILPESLCRKIIRIYGKYYDTNPFLKTKLKPGIKQLLENLKNRGFSLFIITNKPSRPALKIIKKLKINDYFQEISAPKQRGLNHPKKSKMLKAMIRKLHLSSRNTVLVGDGSSDIAAAQKNNLISIAVLNGYGDKKSLISARPNYLIDQTKNLIKIINNL